MSPARAKPSPPRKIGAADNDNRPGESLTANDDTAWTRDQLKRLAKAERKIASRDPQVQAAGRREVLALQAERERRADLADREANRAETLALERARDPEAKITVSEAPATKGRIELGNRDGLKALWLAYSLNEAQYMAGRTYRAAYEEAARTLRSHLNDHKGGGRRDYSAARMAKARDEVVRLERRVVDASGGRVNEIGRRLLCLRQIAGEGVTLHALAGRGRAHERHMLSLRAALDAIG